MQEVTIVQTTDYRVFTFDESPYYYIEYGDRDPIRPYPYYRTLAEVSEALYYSGFLSERSSLFK